MDILQRWIDRWAQRLCEWLHNFFPGNHPLVAVGAGIAGIPMEFPMPVDRIVSPNKFDHTNGGDMANAAGSHRNILKGVNPNDAGTFWAYCHMSGQPCVWCGGRNNITPPLLDTPGGNLSGVGLCPSGTMAGTAWYGCCFDPKGVAKYLAFLDCCSPHVIPCSIIHLPVKNWPDAKDWCQAPSLAVKHRYYCTVIVDMQADDGCK